MTQDSIESIVVYAFGDQTYDAHRLLQILLLSDDPLVSDLTERTTRRLKHEIEELELEPEQRSECPPFASLLDLLPKLKAGTLTPALCQALTCFSQIGAFVASHGYRPRSKPFPTASAACLTGICTGIFSAVAISHSTNSGQLLHLATESIALAFRVGALATNVGSRIASSREAGGTYASWTAAIVGTNVDEIRKQVNDFDKTLSSNPYVSAHVSTNQINVSGAPHNLHKFLSEISSSGYSSALLPIHAPYHAPHLYSMNDVEHVLRSTTDHASTLSQRSIPIISSATGQKLPGDTFADTLRSAAIDCLMHVVRYDLICPAIAAHVSSISTCSDTRVQPVAFGGAERFESAIRANLNSAQGSQDIESIESFLERLQEQELRSNVASRSKIAVLSCAGRFPRANSMEVFWDVLLRGIDTHQLVPTSRWDATSHVSNVSPEKNVSRTGLGCWLEDASAFDAKFFHVSPREAPQMDPAQRIALMCAAEALEAAGIVPGRTPSTQHSRIGVYFGVTSNDWMETNSAQNIDTYFIPGGNRAFIAGRINYHFKFSGPSYSIDTACSSSLTAIQLACNALWRKEIDMAVVGGTNILTNPDMHCGLDRGHFLSRSGNCKTFDASADGYCRGEAVAVVVLKRLDDALQDHDPIEACILSVATNHSAEADSITRPHVGAQKDLIDLVLREAGLSGRSISYAEMHGTGTQAGDVAESNSVVESLSPKNARAPGEPLYIGSAKANVGHGEAAAGITSLAKVLLMLKHSTIPPHCGIQTEINPKMPDLKSRNTFIATERVSWARPEGGSRRVLINNFSAAGGNTALILEDAPQDPVPHPNGDGSDHTIVVSANTVESHRRNMEAMIAWLNRQDISNVALLPGLAYTTTARRMHHPRRLAVTGNNLNRIRDLLRIALDGPAPVRCKSPPKIMFAFAGQGSEFPRMGVDLYEKIHSFRHDIDIYDRMCMRMEFPSILGLFKTYDSWKKATPQALQLAAVCLQMALVRMWASFGVQPTVLVGHSLGEYPALYAAGILSQSDVIYLVGKRAALMQERCDAGSHAMLVVRSSPENIEALLRPFGHKYELACVNGRRNIVLGGTNTELESVNARLQEQGIQTAELPLPYAFHTSQVDTILDDLNTLSASVHFAKQKVPVVSPTFAGVPSDFSSSFTVAHCRKTVHMYSALETAKAQGLIDEHTICIEIGPASVTCKMVKEITGPATETFVSMRLGEVVSRPISLALARLYEKGSTIDWNLYHRNFNPYQGTVTLPAYQWDLQNYWMQYTNDWSIRKGDAIPTFGKPALQSSTIHRVLSDTLHQSHGELIVESDLNREDMRAVVQGHKVYGIPLCTPSVYADIALTIGEHIKRHILSKPTATIEIADMTIQSALVVIPGGQAQILRTAVTLDHFNQAATCTFSSLTATAKSDEQHAYCTLRFPGLDTARSLVARSSPDVFSRIESLYKEIGSPDSETYRFSKSMVYKMVHSVAEFDQDYRGLGEVVMDNHALEATGFIKFENPQLVSGDFNIHPACIDALSQLGGFVMNANESTDLSSEIFVNHGWRSFQIFDTIDPTETYRSHAIMAEGSEKTWSGDVSIFSGEKLTARFGGITLQRVPRRLMEYIVNTAYNKAATACGIDKPDQSASPVRAMATQTVSQRPRSSVSSFDAVLTIISSESGVPVQELANAQSFDDLGVDSLLSLLIVSRIKEELGIELGNSIFTNFGSIGTLRAYVDALDVHVQAVIPRTVTELTLPPPDTPWTSVLAIISQEAGITPQGLSDESSLADLGVDSLLSLLISSRLQEELGIDLGHVSLFVDCETIGELRKMITGPSSRSDADENADDSSSVSASDSSSSRSSWSSSMISPSEMPPEVLDGKIERPIARSLTLQGNTKTAAHRLFLFPDGGGSAISYTKLPLISPTWALVAFDSPFVRKPHLMESSSLAVLLESYLTAIRSHQPHGPYHLGGWSAGGVLAYALASKLLAAKEEVSTLILIDSPSPAGGLDRLPQSFFDHCSSIGIFGCEMNLCEVPSSPVPATPEWLFSHFHATIELLHDYHALPLPRLAGGSGPEVTIIWAGACAFDNQKYAEMPDDDSHTATEMEGIRFLTQRRTDFGPGKWAPLLPGRKVVVHTMRDEHHFSMMRRGAAELAHAIRSALHVRQD